MSVDDKYGHEEILPTVQFVTQDIERWEDMVKRLQERINQARRGLHPEVYKPLKYRKGWHFEAYMGDRTTPRDVRCDDEDDCWYGGNPDRLDGYTGNYVRNDGKEVLCDLCFDGEHYEV